MNRTSDIGELGEQLVAEWLQQQDWVILHHRWRCRWGEIDLIAQHEERKGVGDGEREIWGAGKNLLETSSPLLAFVEVKTRSRGNWDADGMLAITPTKQAKLWQTAQLFLAERPDLANLPCRFDVALVSCQRLSVRSHPNTTKLPRSSTEIDKTLQLSPVLPSQPVFVAGYQLILQDYIQSAFD